MLVQACRRLGSDASVPLAIGFDAVPRGGGPPAQLVEVAVTDAADVRRLEATGLDVTHDVEPGRASVVVYSAAERALLDGLGFATRTVEPDMAAADAADRRREARAAPSSARALPTGRTTYRQPQDYTSDMKTLAEGNPALVRKVTLPRASLEGRPIEGVEIATGVARTDDGRPVYLQMGAHHAREWPSAEFPMEFAVDLVRRYQPGRRAGAVAAGPGARDRGAGRQRRRLRGVARGGPGVLDDDEQRHRRAGGDRPGRYKRKNCRADRGRARPRSPCARAPAPASTSTATTAPTGVGRAPATTLSDQGYRGTSPYSEPESEAVHRFTSGLQVVTFITNHTFTGDGKFLRQPGFDDVIAVTPDEAPMKALGDRMAAATGWTSELGYATLGDITGATEDWNYFAQGTFGYTPEARGTNFHANYADSVIGEYDGSQAPSGGGVYEAFMVAGEQAANPAGHSVITGTAPAGRVLRLRKQFTTATSQAGVTVPDSLDTTMTVPASGRYTWHVNPSKRPLFAGSRGGVDHDLRGRLRAGAGHRAGQRGPRRRATQDFACGGTGAGTAAAAAPTATGRVGAKGLERARLGRKQSTVRTAFARGRRTKGVDRPLLPGRWRRGAGRLPVGRAAAQALAARAGPGEGAGGPAARAPAPGLGCARWRPGPPRARWSGGSARSSRSRWAPRAGTCAAAPAPGTSSA